MPADVPAVDAPPPQSSRELRARLARSYLRGDGVELSPAQPVVMPRAIAAATPATGASDGLGILRDPAAGVTRIDVLTQEQLDELAPGSVHFIVGLHQLQASEDPIATMAAHLVKLRTGGTLFYTVPDQPTTIECRREPTSLQHVIDDHELGPDRSRAEHYLQWASLVHEGSAPRGAEARAEARHLQNADRRIHFHAWTAGELGTLMLHIQRRLGNFEIELLRRNGTENIVVLRKRGQAVPVRGDDDEMRGSAIVGAAAEPGAPIAFERRTPLAGLRVRLDDDQALCAWSIDPDGITGRGLVMPTGRRVAIPLRLAAPARLTAQLRMLPHDWRDGEGRIDARVLYADPAGEHEAWAGTLCASEQGGALSGLAIDCRLPADATSVALALAPHAPAPRGVARAVWVEPALLGPDGPDAAPRPGSADPDAETAPAPRRGDSPLISVLTPVHDPTPRMLRDAVESVRAQTFGDWELCLVDDGSRRPEVIAMLDAYAACDPRIHLTRRAQGGGIADATNAALALATGDYVALLDHDDWLGPDALTAVAEKIAADPGLDMLYTDEDIVLDETPVWVHVKPGWSPDTMRTNGYTCHLGVYRRALLHEIGGFRTKFDGSQDVDMILRLMERTDRIANVPGVHYHWRIHPDSTAGGDAKPYAYVAARNAIAEHLERERIDASVHFGPPGLYRLTHVVPETVEVALVIALDDVAGLWEAARTWLNQSHGAWHVMLAGPAPILGDAVAELRRAGLKTSRIRTCVDDDGDRHTGLAQAARGAEADELVLMQSPCAGLTGDWLARLIGYSRQPGVGAAGPIQLGRNGRVQEAGVAFPGGWPLPLLHGEQTSMNDHFGYGTSVYNVSAVSGMLATSAHTLARAHGLVPGHAELTLVDYCLRLRDGGERIVLVPEARLQITGRDTTMNDLPRLAAIARRQGLVDPYYNPSLRVDRGDFCWR